MKHSIPYGAAFLIIALVFTAVPMTPAEAQYFGRNKVQYDRFDFDEINTEHFRVLFYDENEEVIQDLGRMSERWYTRLSRVFQHEFGAGDRKPLIFYANDADFQQTNVVQGFLGEGTRGVTESLRERVAMPLAADPSGTHRVLGHELVHSFQYDIGLRSEGMRMNSLPLWLVEGMAEYLSSGRQHTLTAMWLRDAALRDDLPSVRDLTNMQQYNPYRYGHGLTAYIGGRYGDETVTQLFQVGGRIGVPQAIDSLTGLSAGELSEQWHEAVRSQLLPPAEGRTPAGDLGRRVLAEDLGHGRANIAPSVSPDGRYVAYLTDRDLFGIDLHVADAETGEDIANLGTVAENPHLDAIRFLSSAGSWSPDSRRIAFVAFAQGDNEIAIWDVGTGRIERRLRLPGVPALENPAWSPDGQHIVVSGLTDGTSNLYRYDLETGDVEQLTEGPHAALQPTWSPDGSTLAYVTDAGPGGTQYERYDFRPMRLALLDVEDGTTEYLAPFGQVTHHNPQFSPDGNTLYFISDQDGFRDVYSYDLASGETSRMTEVQTGISGITELSPALSVARDAGRMMVSVFSDNRYSVVELGEAVIAEAAMEDTDGTPRPMPPAGVLPPYEALDQGIVASYLDDPETGLPADRVYERRDHTRRLSLTAIMPPTLGVGIGGGFGGTQVGGGIGFLFTDLLGDHNLGVTVQAQGTLRDIGGQVSYVNRGQRFNYGASIGRTPLLFAQAFGDRDPEGRPRLNRLVERIYIDQLNLLSEYPVSMTRRFEASVGASRYGFDRRIEQYLIGPAGNIVDRTEQDLEDPDALYFGTGTLAYVVDFSFFGFTSPLQGGRSRYQVSPRIGTAQFVTALGDVRRYLRMAPFTLAGRVFHLGNYGADFNDPFATEYLGSSQYMGFVRGYGFRTFEPEECPPDEGGCPAVERLRGTHVAMASAEVRLPFLGTEQLGLINFPYLPTELSLFADAGLAWTSDDPPVFRFEQETNERVPVFSVGTSARVNVLGAFVFEAFYAYPFQRPDRGAHFGFQLQPGW